MKKKILFIQPSIYDDYGHVVKKNKLYFVGLAYPLLAALTPPDWECEICLETIEDPPLDTDATLIGIGGMGHAANRSKDLAAQFKARGKTVIMGGPMASLVPELAKQYFDSVIIGDAEEIWVQVLRDFEQGNLQPFYKKPIIRLSTPLPRYDLVLNKNIGDFLPVQAGRGCPKRCKFCSIYCLYRKKYFKREICEVIRDIKYVKELGFKKFLLIDDNIIANEKYLYELCNEIKKLNMRWMSQCAITVGHKPELLKLLADSGCETLSFGFESVNQAGLASLDKDWCKVSEYEKIIKNTQDAGIEIASEMIWGVDTDTKETIQQTIDFVLNNKIIAPKFYIMTPIPGTDLYNELLAANRLVEDDVFKYAPTTAVIKHPHMETQEITDTFWEIYNQVYSIRNIIKRTILHKKFLKNPFRYLFFLYVNLYYRYQIKGKIAPNIL